MCGAFLCAASRSFSCDPKRCRIVPPSAKFFTSRIALPCLDFARAPSRGVGFAYCALAYCAFAYCAFAYCAFDGANINAIFVGQGARHVGVRLIAQGAAQRVLACHAYQVHGIEARSATARLRLVH